MDFPRIFKPHEKGLAKILGDLETAIMEVCWDVGPACVRDVYETLRGKRKIAYTTVMTVMARLADKGLLRKELQSKKYVYYPVYTREEITDMVSKEILAGLFVEDREPVLAHLVDIFDKLDHAELEKLRKDIDRVIREQESGGGEEL